MVRVLHERVERSATTNRRAARPTTKPASDPPGEIARLQRLAGNDAVATAIANGDGRLVLQRAKEDGSPDDALDPAGDGGPPSAGVAVDARAEPGPMGGDVGGEIADEAAAAPGPRSAMRGARGAPAGRVTFGEDRVVDVPGDAEGGLHYPTPRVHPAKWAAQRQPRDYESAREKMFEKVDSRSAAALADGLANGRATVTWVYRGHGVVVRKQGDKYVGYRFFGWPGVNDRVYDFVSRIGSGDVGVDDALAAGAMWSVSLDAELANGTQPFEWAGAAAPADRWAATWDDQKAPIGERDLAIMRAVISQAGGRVAADDLADYSNPFLYRLRGKVAKFLDARGPAVGPLTGKAQRLGAEIVDSIAAETRTFRKYSAGRSRLGNPFAPQTRAGPYLVAAWFRRRDRAAATTTLPLRRAHLRPPTSSVGRAFGIGGLLLGIGGAATAGAMFAGAASKALSAKWLTPTLGGLIAGGGVALLAAAAYGIYRAAKKNPTAPLDYAAEVAQARAAADSARAQLDRARRRMRGLAANARPEDSATYVAAQDASERSAAVARSYQVAPPPGAYAAMAPSRSIERMITVLVDTPPADLTPRNAQIYGVGLYRLLNQDPVALPPRPEGGPAPVQLVDGDPGSGVLWEQRVQAQAENRRADMARAIAAQIGFDAADADAPLRVVEFLNRRAGRIPDAPVAAGGLGEV